MEITKREVLFSLVIIILSLTIGFFVRSSIVSNRIEELELYTKALEVQEIEDFNYALETKVGNVLAFDDCYSMESVSLSELKQEYSVIMKIKEEYTSHTESYKDSKGNTNTRTTYSWDRKNKQIYNVNEIVFMDRKLSINLFEFDEVDFEVLNLNQNTVNEDVLSLCNSTYYYPNGKRTIEGNCRYRYYVIPLKFSGTMFMDLNADTFTKDNTEFYLNKTIEEVIELKSNTESGGFFFWLVWLFVTFILVFIFYFIDNKWLEDKNSKKEIWLSKWLSLYNGKFSEVIKIVLFSGIFLVFLYIMVKLTGINNIK